MEYLNNLLALSSIIFLIVLLSLKLPIINKTNALIKVISSVIIGIFSIIVPIYHGFSLAFLVRGIIGDLSITSCLVILILIINNLFSLKIQIINLKTSWIIFGLGTILYLATFAIIPIDIYAIGYYPKYWLIIFVLSELYFWRTDKFFAAIWLIALINFYFRLQVSINLWDYLLDPILYLILFSQILLKIFKFKRPVNYF